MTKHFDRLCIRGSSVGGATAKQELDGTAWEYLNPD